MIEYGPLPAAVPSAVGAIPVTVCAALEVDGAPVYGLFDPERMTIAIDVALGPRAAHLTLWHERIHAALWLAGVRELSDDTEETVCHVVAAAIMQALDHGRVNA